MDRVQQHKQKRSKTVKKLRKVFAPGPPDIETITDAERFFVCKSKILSVKKFSGYNEKFPAYIEQKQKKRWVWFGKFFTQRIQGFQR